MPDHLVEPVDAADRRHDDFFHLDPVLLLEVLADRVVPGCLDFFPVQAQVIGGKVRIERENGHRFITDVVEAFPGEIEAVSVSKPTLEDVFIHRTGHRFWTEANGEANE